MLDKTVVLNIRHVRESKNLKQEYVAEQLGISAATYSKIENNKIKLTTNRLQKIAGILNVSLIQLTTNDYKYETDQQLANQYREELTNAKQQIAQLLQERLQYTECEQRLLEYIRMLQGIGK